MVLIFALLAAAFDTHAGCRPFSREKSGRPADQQMFARNVHVEVLGSDGARDCPLPWLDSFCMRSFTGSSAFDATLPVAEGHLEAGFQVDLTALQAGMEDWMTRKFGRGGAVRLRLTEAERLVPSK